MSSSSLFFLLDANLEVYYRPGGRLGFPDAVTAAGWRPGFTNQGRAGLQA
jgi:hypothetical protein